MAKIDDVYDAVAEGFGTATVISKVTSIPVRAVSAYLTVLRRRKEISIQGVVRKPSKPKWLRDADRPIHISKRIGRMGAGSNSYVIRRDNDQ